MTTPDAIDLNQPLCLFDGVCNLCNRSVRFILWAETNATAETAIRFAAIQSDVGRAVLEQIGMPGLTNSFVFVEDGVASLRSVAAFRLARHFRAPWRWVRVFALLPVGVTDWLYDRLADNRYRLFGTRALCLVPAPEQRARFLGRALT